MPELSPVGDARPVEPPPEPVVVPIVGWRYLKDNDGAVLIDDEGEPMGEPTEERFVFRGMTTTGVLMQTMRLMRGGETAEVGRRAFDSLLDWVIDDDRDRLIDYASECVSSETLGKVVRSLVQHYINGPSKQRPGSQSSPTTRGATSRAAASGRASTSKGSPRSKGSASSSRTRSTTPRASKASHASKRASASRSGSRPSQRRTT
jgi:hypothetical protein